MITSGCNCRVLTGSTSSSGLVQFAWSPENPAQVTMSMFVHARAEAGWVEWVFARDLLADGLVSYAPGWAGVGDVRVTCWDLLHLRVEFCSPDGSAIVVVPWSVVDLFLRRTFRACPVEAEDEAYELVTRVAVDKILRRAA